ncbi:hypothetical protein HK098_005003 [Nowakowskiella sp. JEL0407]|nr:hypothetical protein HK098_005003 [Nowakowskiella sp. JEL0407]
MCVSSMIAASSTVMGRFYVDNGYATACKIQGFNFQTFYVASSLWSSAIATSLILVVKFRVPPPNLFKYERYYHLVCWGVPLAISLSYVFGDFGKGEVYGDATFWCWLRDEYNNLRVFGFFGVMWICFLYNSICYGTVGYILYKSQKHLMRANKWGSNNGSVGDSSSNSDFKGKSGTTTQNSGGISRSEDKTMRRFTKRTSAYILAFMIIWTPGTVNRIQNLVEVDKPIYVLFVIHALCLPIGGFMEAVIWFTPVVLRFFRQYSRDKEELSEYRRRDAERNTDGLSRSSISSSTVDVVQMHQMPVNTPKSIPAQVDIDEVSRGNFSAHPVVPASIKPWMKQRTHSGSSDMLWNPAEQQQQQELDTTWNSIDSTVLYAPSPVAGLVPVSGMAMMDPRMNAMISPGSVTPPSVSPYAYTNPNMLPTSVGHASVLQQPQQIQYATTTFQGIPGYTTNNNLNVKQSPGPPYQL